MNLLKGEILRVFGRDMLDYVKRLAKGHIDYLPRLPENVLMKIVLFLDLEDIGYLAQVSKKFFEVKNLLFIQF